MTKEQEIENVKASRENWIVLSVCLILAMATYFIGSIFYKLGENNAYKNIAEVISSGVGGENVVGNTTNKYMISIIEIHQ